MSDNEQTSPDYRLLAKGKNSPFDTAANKLRESIAKEAQSKIDAQLKKTIDAKKIFDAERNELQRLIKDYENDKAIFADVIKELT